MMVALVMLVLLVAWTVFAFYDVDKYVCGSNQGHKRGSGGGGIDYSDYEWPWWVRWNPLIWSVWRAVRGREPMHKTRSEGDSDAE